MLGADNLRIEGTFRGQAIVRATIQMEGKDRFEVDPERAKVYRIDPEGTRVEVNRPELSELRV